MVLSRLVLSCLFSWVLVVVAGCDGSGPNQPNESVGGRIYLNGDLSTAIYEVDLGSGTVRYLASGREPFPTEESTLIITDVNGLYEISLDGVQRRTILARDNDDGLQNLFNDEFYNPQVSPDGLFVLYENQTYGDFFIVTRTGGELVYSFSDPDFNIARPTWTETGEIVFAGRFPDVGLYILDAEGAFYSRFDPDLDSPTDPAVSPDGGRVAFVMNGDLYVIRIDGSDLTRVSESARIEGWPVWSPDGRMIAVYGNSGSTIIHSLDDGELADLREFSDELRNFFRSRAFTDDQFCWLP